MTFHTTKDGGYGLWTITFRLADPVRVPGRASGAWRLRRLSTGLGQSRVPGLVGHFPRVSYVRLVGSVDEGKMMVVIMEWEGTPGAVHRFPGTFPEAAAAQTGLGRNHGFPAW